MGSDHKQGKFQAMCKFIMIDINGINIDSYVIKIAHMTCSKPR